MNPLPPRRWQPSTLPTADRSACTQPSSRVLQATVMGKTGGALRGAAIDTKHSPSWYCVVAAERWRRRAFSVVKSIRADCCAASPEGATTLSRAMAQLKDARGEVLAACLAPLPDRSATTGPPAAGFTAAAASQEGAARELARLAALESSCWREVRVSTTALTRAMAQLEAASGGDPRCMPGVAARQQRPHRPSLSRLHRRGSLAGGGLPWASSLGGVSYQLLV